MFRKSQEYSFLRTFKINHPFPRDACAIAELMYIKYFASLSLSNQNLVPKKIHIWQSLRQIELDVINKPSGFGTSTSLVVNSTDPKYLGVIMAENKPSRIVYSGARYEEKYPPGVITRDEYAEIKSTLRALGLPYPNTVGQLVPILESLLEQIGVNYDTGFSANISQFSQLYETKFPKSTSGLWPLSKRD